MKFKRLTSAAGADFEPAFDLYGVSFPIHEQRLIESQRSIMTHPEYLFDLIYDDSGEWCGDMLYWETADFIYVEHFCILPAVSYGLRWAWACRHVVPAHIVTE